MSEALDEFVQVMAKEAQNTPQMIERVVAAADCSRVFSPPVSSGEYTVITAAEVGGGAGFGSGMGFGPSDDRSANTQEASATAGEGEVANRHVGAGVGVGRGNGGGGGSMGRPVATIIIGPEGVEVRPVLDVTKLGLAALTAFGAVGALAVKILKEQIRAERA